MILERLRAQGIIRPLDDHFARLMVELARQVANEESERFDPRSERLLPPPPLRGRAGAGGVEQGTSLVMEKKPFEFLPPQPSPARGEGEEGIGNDPGLALAAALASRRTADGHVCLDLHGPLAVGEAGLPSPDRWIEGLRPSPVIGRPGEFRPLILDDAGRLYLYRYWNYEKRIADAVLERSKEIDPTIDQPLLREGLDRLFPRDPQIQPDWQRIGAAVAVLRRFCILSGGPGTGKTTTVVRILALLLEQHREPGRPMRIALAAPTGKAAARLQETIRRARDGLKVSAEIRGAIPDRAQTIHRLLGANPATGRFRHHRDNPLPVDLLVVDESSMVDIALAARLVEALRPETRLILLGDRDQLASVEAGAVLGDLCAGSEGFSPEFRGLLEAVTGEDPTGFENLSGLAPDGRIEPPSRLSDAVVMLRHSYRFGGGIGRLAQAVNRGDGAAALDLLQGDGEDGVILLPRETDPATRAAQGYLEYLRAVQRGEPPERVFPLYEGFRVLCALREGEFGVEGINAEVERLYGHQGLIDRRSRFYAGRPVLVTRNDPALHLANGDVGLILPDAGGRLQAWFPTSDGGLRSIAPARLPPHETAWALTIHKSQGSEFERVLLVLPPADLPLLTRELVYTGITRARRWCEVTVRVELLPLILGRVVKRNSGLRERLSR